MVSSRFESWILGISAGLVCLVGATAQAETLAYWRFEEGVGKTQATAGDKAVPDSSPLQNHLQVEQADKAPKYSEDVPFPVVVQTGEPNQRSCHFDGSDEFTLPGSAPLCNVDLGVAGSNAWTIEASFKLEQMPKDRWHGIVVKDLIPTIMDNGNPNKNPLLVLKHRPDPWDPVHANKLAIEVVDGSGAHRTLRSKDPLEVKKWYSVVATGSATELALWLKGENDPDYVLQGTLSLQGAMYSRENKNTTWGVGRGFWENRMGDWMEGSIDEVRISNVVLDKSEFLGSPGNPSSPAGAPGGFKTIAIADASFDDNKISDETIRVKPGKLAWDFVPQPDSDPGYWNPPAQSYQGADGNRAPQGGTGANVAFFYTQNPVSTPAHIEQALGVAATPATSYSLTVGVGRRLPGSKYVGTFGGYRIELLAGSTVIGSQTDAVATVPGRFVDATLLVPAAAIPASVHGQELRIRLSMPAQAATANVDFDNVRLTAISSGVPTLSKLIKDEEFQQELSAWAVTQVDGSDITWSKTPTGAIVSAQVQRPPGISPWQVSLKQWIHQDLIPGQSLILIAKMRSPSKSKVNLYLQNAQRPADKIIDGSAIALDEEFREYTFVGTVRERLPSEQAQVVLELGLEDGQFEIASIRLINASAMLGR